MATSTKLMISIASYWPQQTPKQTN